LPYLRLPEHATNDKPPVTPHNKPANREGTTRVDKELRPGPQFAPRWYSVAQVAQMLGFGLSKTKMLVATGELRSLKDGKHRRILPEWVDEYIERRVKEGAA
jgi:excisionase family DNA binding protein